MSKCTQRVCFSLDQGTEFRFFSPMSEEGVLYKEALLIEDGVFNRHELTADNIRELKANLTRKIPLQVDHGRDPWQIFGRLEDGMIVEEDGKTRLYGLLRIVDPEAQTRILDGRWSELSVGFQFAPFHRLFEVSVVTNPAFYDAAILKQDEEASPMDDDQEEEKTEEMPAEEAAPEAEEDTEEEEPLEEDLSAKIKAYEAELAASRAALAETARELDEERVDKTLVRLNAARYITPAQMPVARELLLGMDAELRGKLEAFITLGMKQWSEGRLSLPETAPTSGGEEDQTYLAAAAAREKRMAREKQKGA